MTVRRIRMVCLFAWMMVFSALGLAQSDLPPLAAGQARVVIYRPWHYTGGSTGIMIADNGKFIGIARAGRYFYADAAPGMQYLRGYWAQMGTIGDAAEQTVSLRAGATMYIKLNVGFTDSMQVVGADEAMAELRKVHFDATAAAEKDSRPARQVERAKSDFEKYAQSSGVNFGAGAVGAAGAGTTDAGTTLSSYVPAPTSVPVAMPAAGSSVVPSGFASAQGGGVAAGTRVALVVNARCARDPDPLGLVSGSLYMSCSQKQLRAMRASIATSLTQRGIQVTDGSGGFDEQFVVTLTKVMDKRPSTLIPFSDFMGGTMVAEASFQVLDAAGRVLQSGKVADQGPDKNSAQIQKDFEAKIAASLTISPSVTASIPSVMTGLAAQAGTTPVAGAAPAPITPLQQFEEVRLYSIVAQSYRALGGKLPVSDTARAEYRKAEDWMTAGDYQVAAASYAKALTADPWWPQGFRGLALALGQSGHAAGAAIWMRRYLDFVPNAPDATAMQAKADAWSRLANLPPPPTSMAEPAGSRLGVLIHDTPGIVALALGQPDMDGALISYVFPGSAADKAGLQEGDVVIGSNGKPVRSAGELLAAVSQTGAASSLQIQRGNSRITVAVALPPASQQTPEPAKPAQAHK